MIDLDGWSAEERKGLFDALDGGFKVPEEIPQELADAAKAYREHHGYYRHPGFNASEMNVVGFVPDLEVKLIADDQPLPDPWAVPKIATRVLTRKILAVRNRGGGVEILTRYFGQGVSSAPAWVEV